MGLTRDSAINGLMLFGDRRFLNKMAQTGLTLFSLSNHPAGRPSLYDASGVCDALRWFGATEERQEHHAQELVGCMLRRHRK